MKIQIKVDNISDAQALRIGQLVNELDGAAHCGKVGLDINNLNHSSHLIVKFVNEKQWGYMTDVGEIIWEEVS